MFFNAECNEIHPKTLTVTRPYSFTDTYVMNGESTNKSKSITVVRHVFRKHGPVLIMKLLYVIFEVLCLYISSRLLQHAGN